MNGSAFTPEPFADRWCVSVALARAFFEAFEARELAERTPVGGWRATARAVRELRPLSLCNEQENL